jgi:hypothetical protein
MAVFRIGLGIAQIIRTDTRSKRDVARARPCLSRPLYSELSISSSTSSPSLTHTQQHPPRNPHSLWTHHTDHTPSDPSPSRNTSGLSGVTRCAFSPARLYVSARESTCSAQSLHDNRHSHPNASRSADLVTETPQPVVTLAENQAEGTAVESSTNTENRLPAQASRAPLPP